MVPIAQDATLHIFLFQKTRLISYRGFPFTFSEKGSEVTDLQKPHNFVQIHGREHVSFAV